MADHHEMWGKLGLDLARHDELMGILGQFYGDLYVSQSNRPKGMEYFDFVISEVHGLRVQELLDHKAQGGYIAGTFCVYVPEELILATGGVCVGLCAGTDFTAADGEAILPRNLCPLIKSAVGFKEANLCPYMKSCDIVIGETTCDGKKKAWEILAKDTQVHVMEVPQKASNRGNGMWLNEVQELRKKLEEVSGRKITAEGLREATAKVKAKRAALRRLYELRKNSAITISGKDALLISQIAFYDDVDRFTAKVNELCDELDQRVKDGNTVFNGVKRLLIAGTPMAIPNWKLHHIVETSGAAVVCEETCTGTRYFTNEVELKGDEDVDGMLAAIAERYVKTPCACFTPNDQRLENVAAYAKEYNADGVIDYTLAFCHCYNVEHQLLRECLEKEGIPLLHIETDYSMGDFGQLTTRVKAFLETLE